MFTYYKYLVAETSIAIKVKSSASQCCVQRVVKKTVQNTEMSNAANYFSHFCSSEMSKFVLHKVLSH